MLPLDASATVRAYLAPFASAPWRWDPHGEVIEWTDGSTIAFRPELAIVLARLAPWGLPPLSAIVMLLAACRDGWPGESHLLGTMAGSLATIGRNEFPDWLGELFQRLDAIRSLPPELRATPAAKAALAEMVFETCRSRTLPEVAEAVRWSLSSYLSAEMLTPQSDTMPGLESVFRDLRCLHEGIQKFDPEKLKLRNRTSLDQLVQPADFEMPPAEMARRLIARLHDDQELGGMARIARQLLAAIHLPHALSDREDLPVGGVSDITNRGSLDRLLISELSHDDLTLAVRIALREALYLRRETPPKNPPKHRAVLIDAGIRLWGIPRVFATAVALTLAATSDRNIRVDAYRACGKTVEPVSLTRREGLIAHLEALEPDVHPGDALDAFLAAVSKSGELVDAVVVTGEDVAEDRHFQQAIASREVASLLLATVNREGRFRLISWGNRRRKILREARLDLEKLLATSSQPAVPLLDPAATAIPAIFKQKPFPLLLSHPQALKQAWQAPDGSVLSLGFNCGLLHWKQPGRGGQLLDVGLPSGQVHWTGSESNSISLAVVGEPLHRSHLWLLRVNIAAENLVATGKIESIPLELSLPAPKHICGHGGKVFAVYSESADVFATANGRRLDRIKLPFGGRRHHGRFLECGNEWYALCDDGLSAKVERLSSGKRTQGSVISAVFDHPGVEGPFGMLADGHLYDFSHDRVIRVSHGLLGCPSIMAVARNGERIVVAQRDNRGKMAVIEVPSGAARSVSGNPKAFAEPEIFRFAAGMRNVCRRFRAICVKDGKTLSLVRHKGSSVCLQLDQHHHEIILQPDGYLRDQLNLSREFEEMHSSNPVVNSLQTATWSDGSRAVLDSRGMLHLKSSNPVIPELALVLCNGALAGWCADGRWFGPEHFIGDHAPTRGAVIYEEVLKPFVAQLR